MEKNSDPHMPAHYLNRASKFGIWYMYLPPPAPPPASPAPPAPAPPPPPPGLSCAATATAQYWIAKLYRPIGSCLF